MSLVHAKRQAEGVLREFVDVELTTEVLNEIENRVNGLIESWSTFGFSVWVPFGPRGGTSGHRYTIFGVKLKFNDHSGDLEMSYRY